MSRRKSRITAFQGLYTWDVGGMTEKDVLELNWVESNSVEAREGEDSEAEEPVSKAKLDDESAAFSASFFHLFTVCHATPASAAAFLTPISATRESIAAISGSFSSFTTSVFLGLRPLFFSSTALSSSLAVDVALAADSDDKR